jgi:hypothetical protein
MIRGGRRSSRRRRQSSAAAPSSASPAAIGGNRSCDRPCAATAVPFEPRPPTRSPRSGRGAGWVTCAGRLAGEPTGSDGRAEVSTSTDVDEAALEGAAPARPRRSGTRPSSVPPRNPDESSSGALPEATDGSPAGSAVSTGAEGADATGTAAGAGDCTGVVTAGAGPWDAAAAAVSCSVDSAGGVTVSTGVAGTASTGGTTSLGCDEAAGAGSSAPPGGDSPRAGRNRSGSTYP